jgi:type II secretory pathway pseudopilin PulG
MLSIFGQKGGIPAMSVSSNKHTAGFTLVNVLLFLAISSILLAIAIPALTALNRKLELQQLDASARHIFIAAQNQLTALRSNGNVTLLSAATPLSEEPNDYSGTDWHTLSYLDSSNPSHASSLQILLPQGSIDPSLQSGNFVVELDLGTGCVYSVFYSDNSFSYTTDLPRNRAERYHYDLPLGYYGGNVLEGGWDALALPAPTVTITNEETLSVTFYTDNPFPTITDGAFFNGLTYTITVRSEEDPSLYNTFSSDLFPSPFTRDIYTYTLLLDSLVAGEQFQDICPDVPPGDTLSITVSVSYSGSAGIALPSSTTQSANSLFASRSDQTVTLAYARHLQNLEPSVSGVGTVTSAVQVDAIDWAYYEMDFTPISNSEITSFDGSGLSIRNLTVGSTSTFSKAGLFGEFAGGTLSNIRLVNASITGGTYTGGLLGYCNHNLTIDNAALYVDDVANAATYQVRGSRYVGGLVAYCRNLVISNSFAAPGSLSGGASNGAMGGLVAYCDGGASNISRCYANSTISSNTSPIMGGLVGYFGGTRIQNSYALGNLSSASSQYYAGFVGSSSDAVYTNCYAAATFDGAGASTTPYGFSASNLQQLTNCVSLQQNTYEYSTPNSTVPIISYAALTTWTGGTAWTAAAWPNTHPYSAELLSEGNPYPFPRLKSLEHYNDWPEEATFDYTALFAYYERYQDGSYGYHALDASENVILDTLFDTKGALIGDGYVFLTKTPLTWRNRNFYYRSSMHWSQYLGSTTIAINGTSTLYYQYAVPDYNFDWNYFDNPLSFYEPFIIDDATYWCCPNFAKTAINGATTAPAFDGTVFVRSTRHLSTLGSRYNSFYCTNSNFTFIQELDLDFNLNSYNFLDGIGYSWSSPFRGFYQGNHHSIILDNVSSSWDQALFGYNSGTIQNVNVYTTEALSLGASGLASGVLSGVNYGTIANSSVTFGANCTGYGTYFGAIAGLNTGTITNCLLTTTDAITLSGNYNLLGGFVGENSGSISDSHVRPGVSNYAGLTINGAERAAGFVYRNIGTIYRCSAVGTVNATANWGGVAAGFACYNVASITNSYSNCLVSGFHAAGFAYLSNDSTSIIENCYAMVKVSANQAYGNAAGFTFLGTSRTRNSYVAAEVSGSRSYTFSGQPPHETCYYLDWSKCGFDETGVGLTQPELTQSFVADSVNWGGANTYVYRDQYNSLPDSCPFPLITDLDHYGDWPVTPSAPTSLPLADMENVLGVFYYERRTNDTFYISAAALQYDTPRNSKIPVLAFTFTDFVKADIDLSSYLSTYTLYDSGYGVFWAKNISSLNKFYINNVRLDSLNKNTDLGIHDFYYFIPFPDATTIRYSHDNSGKRSWHVSFFHSPETDTFIALPGY